MTEKEFVEKFLTSEVGRTTAVGEALLYLYQRIEVLEKELNKSLFGE